jgi:lipoate-protein ligase A
MQRHRILLRATTLEEAIGRILTFDKVAQALAAGFAHALNLTLVLDGVTARERRIASELRDRLYSAPDWTTRL